MDDWCEPKYAYYSHIAELWNSLSNIPIILVGILGAKRSVSHQARSSFCLIILIGIGSLFYHVTLDWHFQLLDQIPMFMLQNYLFANFNHKYSEHIYFIGMITMILQIYSKVDMLFHGMFGSMWLINAALVFMNSKKEYYKYNILSTIIALFGWANWLIDHWCCSITGHIFGHTIWHVCIAMHSYILGVLADDIFY